jgi:ELWxxDGT repeat protein
MAGVRPATRADPTLSESSVEFEDPDLEEGFPATVITSPGTYHGGPNVYTLVGNIDEDPESEILVSSLASGPLFAWNADGSPLPGWPTGDTSGVLYPALGDLLDSAPGLEVVAGNWPFGVLGRLQAYSGDGSPLYGWPRGAPLDTVTAPSLADLDRDGLDEVIVAGGDRNIYVYRADGREFPAWPSGGVPGAGPQAVADLDSDGTLEVVSEREGFLYAHHHDGSPVAGFPEVLSTNSHTQGFPVIGDVDGDGALEIVVVLRVDTEPGRVWVVSATGAVENTWLLPRDFPHGTAPALADIAGGAAPEIVVQADGFLGVYGHDGTSLPGWPVTWENHWHEDSAPVVGDVDGDQSPDIVITTQIAGLVSGELRAYDAQGRMLEGFPKKPPSWDESISQWRGEAVPAIADIDLDGRNEIIVAGHFGRWAGYWDGLWVYDLGGPAHGPVEWGQALGGPHHWGVYPVPEPQPAVPPPTGSPSSSPALVVRDIWDGPRGSDPSDLTDVNGRLYFGAASAATGRELWTSGGVPPSAGPVQDIRPGPRGSNPTELTAMGDTLFFVANDGTTGVELWRSDGTPGGTTLVKDIWPGPRGSSPRGLVNAAGTLYFSAWDGSAGYELWKSDGTPSGTQIVKDILVVSVPNPHGEAAGSDPRLLTPVGSKVFFTAETVVGPTGSAGIGLFVSDGTATGTKMLGDQFVWDPQPWFPGEIARFEDRVYVTNAKVLGRSDGTNLGTVWFSGLFDSNFWSDKMVSYLTAGHDRLYFRAGWGDSIMELWQIDGPSPGGIVKDIAPWPYGSYPSHLEKGPQSTLLFGATDTSAGFELWITEGTASSTRAVRDIRPGPRSSSPMHLTSVGSFVLFTADDGTSGHELWITDGTEAGTQRLQDVAPGPRSSNITEFEASGGFAYLSADDGTIGQELWAAPLDRLHPEDRVPPETFITSGPSGSTAAQDATFEFSSSEADSAFECQLDSTPPVPCVSPRSYSGLAAGTHVFAVRAIDQAGNPDPTPATRTWSITAAGLSVQEGSVSPETRAQALCRGREATLIGSPGNDLLKGGPGPDVIAALAGNDVVKGLEGRDVLCGGPGRDRLHGGLGSDQLLGGVGTDACRGGPGRDSARSCEHPHE